MSSKLVKMVFVAMAAAETHESPWGKLPSDLVVEGINTGDTVGLLIEVRCLKGNTYTISPIRIHVY